MTLLVLSALGPFKVGAALVTGPKAIKIYRATLQRSVSSMATRPNAASSMAASIMDGLEAEREVVHLATGADIAGLNATQADRPCIDGAEGPAVRIVSAKMVVGGSGRT